MPLPGPFRDAPVRRKLIYIVFLSAGAALLFAMLVMAVQQGLMARDEMVSNMSDHAEVVATNSAPALLAGDKNVVKRTMSALANMDAIEFAEIHDRDGQSFVSYVRAGENAPPEHAAMPTGERHTFSAMYLDLYHPIMANAAEIGTVHIHASLRPLYEKIWQSMATLLAATLGGMLVAWMLVTRMHQVITQPIAELIGLMNRVSGEKNYALRQPPGSKDELGVLGAEFNEMLEQIELREHALEQHRMRLEQDVAQRTASLNEMQRIAHLGGWEWDVANNHLYWSDEMYRIFGRDPQKFEANYEAFLDAVHPEDRQLVDSAVQGAIKKHHPYIIDYRLRLPDGGVRFAHAQGEVIFDPDGTPVKMLGTVQDITERKLAEQAVHKANIELSLFRTLLDNSIDAIEVMDPATLRFLDVNARECRDLGYSREELLSMTVYDIDPSLTPDVMQMINAQIMKSGTSLHEGVHRRKDGSSFPVEVSTSLVHLDRPYVLNIIRDITERKQVEEQMRKQQELTTQIVEIIPMRVFWKDRALHYVGCNTAFAKDAGMDSPDKMIGKNDFQMPWREQAELYITDDRLVMDNDTPKISYEEPQTTPTGKKIWLHTSKLPLHNAAGEVTGVLGIYEDVTDRVEAREELEWKNSVLFAQQEFSPDAILLVDDEAKIVFYNQRFADMWKIPKELLQARVDEPVLQAVVAMMADPETFLSRAKYLYEHKGEKSHEELLLKDGRIIDRYSSAVFGTDGSYYGRVWYFRDISERKQTEEKVRKLNTELESKVEQRTRQLLDTQEELVRKEKLAVLGQVAGSVGHELRNPLGVMNNAVYFLQTVLSDADETTREYLNIIKDEIAVSERIVSDLLDSVRTKPPRPERVGVMPLIEQALRKCAVPENVTLALDIPEAIPPLKVDSMQIHQVFRNLISNGLEAMPEGGELAIRAVPNAQAETVTISVQDSGTGMTPEQQEKLFQPLFTTKARGIGLGLVVVKNLTQANGGSLEVQSEWGKGTTFAVTLPMIDERENEHA